MALITRVTRLFRADMHAVLDHIEEPDVLLKQAIREMEEDVYQDERRSKEITLEQKQIATRQDDQEQALKKMEEELDICFSSNKKDLARSLIRRKLETQRFIQHLEQKRIHLDGLLGEIGERLKENRSRLESLRQKAELLMEDSHITDSEYLNTPDLSVRDEDVEVAFLKEQQKRGSQ